jgi:hypothetical protein
MSRSLDEMVDSLELLIEDAAVLTTKKRSSLKDSDFAVPGKRKLPIHDCSHARNAAARLPMTMGLSPEEMKMAKQRIKKALSMCRGK